MKIKGLFGLALVFVLVQPSFSLSKGRKTVLMERANQFHVSGLISLAREQYEYIARKDPKDTLLKKKVAEMRQVEAKHHYQNAVKAREIGALRMALLETNRSLEADQQNKRAYRQKKELEKEIQLQDGLRKRISVDYLDGLKKFQNQKYDRALESFIKVLNMDPHHNGALTYIEKIGQRIDQSGGVK